MIFVNLPVKDLPRATAFYTSLGFEQNMQFSDENASAIVISDTITVMLLAVPFFQTFTAKPVGDPAAQTSAIFALSAESREAVDELVRKAVAAGGQEAREAQDMGFMYQRAFNDLDGHLWETAYMDMSQVPEHMG